jgi:hypothetical protein
MPDLAARSAGQRPPSRASARGRAPGCRTPSPAGAAAARPGAPGRTWWQSGCEAGTAGASGTACRRSTPARPRRRGAGRQPGHQGVQRPPLGRQAGPEEGRAAGRLGDVAQRRLQRGPHPPVTLASKGTPDGVMALTRRPVRRSGHGVSAPASAKVRRTVAASQPGTSRAPARQEGADRLHERAKMAAAGLPSAAGGSLTPLRLTPLVHQPSGRNSARVEPDRTDPPASCRAAASPAPPACPVPGRTLVGHDQRALAPRSPGPTLT